MNSNRLYGQGNTVKKRIKSGVLIVILGQKEIWRCREIRSVYRELNLLKRDMEMLNTL